jgi:hypothetical protein
MAASAPGTPIVVFSTDPALISAMRATVSHTTPVIQLTEAPGRAAWAAGDAGAVVLDVTPELRRSAYREIRRRHRGRLVLIIDAEEGAEERTEALPADAARLTMTRPFAVAELLEVLSSPLPETAAAEETGQGPRRLAGSLRALSRRPARDTVITAVAIMLLLTAWFVVGLLRSARELNLAARAARTELATVDSALTAGNPAKARRALEGVEVKLSGADAVAARQPMPLAARLPVLSAAVQDLRHLLGAAHSATRAAGLAIAIYDQADSGRPTPLFRDQRVDLATLGRMRRQADRLSHELTAARRQLRSVRAGPLAPGAARARSSGLRQLDQLEARVRTLVPTLELLPSVLGDDRPRTYLIVLTTSAELRPSGGTPLAAVRARVDAGRIVIQEGDARVSLHHAKARWRAVPGDPWATGGRFDDFSMANSSPHFPTSGQELLAAYRVLTGTRPDGVLCVDPMALRALLRTTGPVSVPGYGNVTAANVGRLTMRQAYDRWPEAVERRRYNQQLVGAILRRFLDGQLLLRKLQALGAEAAERRVQLYAPDPRVQELLGRAGLDGALTPAAHDYLAVFTHNTNASRVDYFQRRSVDQRIQLRPDGSASVTRTIRVQNRAPVSGALDPARQTGYTSAYSRATVATYLPPRGRLGSVQVDGRPVRAAVAEEAGRPLVRVATELAPGRGVTVRVGYLLPPPPGRQGDAVAYELVADPQPMAEPPQLRIQVVAPEGTTIRPRPGWTVQASSARATIRFNRTIRSHLEVQWQ